jgi:hypothetical protein
MIVVQPAPSAVGGPKVRYQLDGSIGGFERDEVCHVRDYFGCAPSASRRLAACACSGVQPVWSLPVTKSVGQRI